MSKNPVSKTNWNGRTVGKCFVILIAGIGSLLTLAVSSGMTRYASHTVIEHLESGQHFLQLLDYENARSEFEEALKVDPKSIDALNNIGVVYLRLSQWAKAKEYFLSALKIDPHFVPSLSNLGEVYYLEGRLDQAIAIYREALPLAKGKDLELQTNLANVLRDKGQLQEAAKHYSAALKVKSSYAPAHNGFAKLYFLLGQYDQAYDQVTQAIKAKPDYSMAYYHLGLIASAKGNHDEAIKAYLLSLKYEKNEMYAQDTRLRIKNLGGDTNTISADDLARFEATIRAGEIEKPALSQGLAFWLNLGKQKASFEQARLLISQHKWSDAERELEALRDATPVQDPVLLNDLGLTLAAQHNFSSASAFYQKAIKLSQGKCISAYYNLGQLYRSKGDLQSARREFLCAIASAKQQRKSCPLAHNALAIVLKQLGDTDGAARSYKLAISQAGTDLPVIHYNYAILLEKTDHTREAVQEYRTYLKLAPQGLSIQQAQARLKRLGVDS
jgi:tetratricopeptide (TPR) repeat protein